jgi:hypothetical protein
LFFLHASAFLNVVHFAFPTGAGGFWPTAVASRPAGRPGSVELGPAAPKVNEVTDRERPSGRVSDVEATETHARREVGWRRSFRGLARVLKALVQVNGLIQLARDSEGPVVRMAHGALEVLHQVIDMLPGA